MHRVTIYKVATSECVDTRDFLYGDFKEIGYWLDYYGYIDPRYEVKIRFTS